MNQSILDKLEKFFDVYEQRSYNSGQVIVRADHEPLGILYLEQGIIEQYDISADGNKVSLNVYRPPAFFPMSWAINNTSNPYFYEAVSPVKLRIADPVKTLQFVKSNPDVLFDLLGRVYKGTDALLRRLAIARSGIAVERLMYELLIECYRFGEEVRDGLFTITVKQSVLATRGGLARETVSRELHKLDQRNLIELSRQSITVNTKKLENELGLNR